MQERISSGGESHYSICCENGKTCELPSFNRPTPILDELLTSPEKEARTFREEIRSYNAAFAFMSVGAKVSAPSGYGLSVFRIHGAVCHYTGSLRPPEGAEPVYAQLYVYDPQESLDYRVKRNPKADRETMERLQTEIAAVSYTHLTLPTKRIV